MAQFTNQASILYNGILVNSNTVTGEITQVMTAWKDATVGSYSAGDILNYVISIQNSGATDITGLTITDDLGEYPFGTGTVTPLTYTGDPVLYYINGILQASPTVTAGPPLEITGINVPTGLSATVIYRAEVNEYAPLGTAAVIENTATISGGGLSELVTAAETVTNDPATALTIIKSLDPATVVENGQVTYTLTVYNSGATAADDAAEIVISDTFAPPLSVPLAVTLNGVTWPQVGNYTYNPSSGAFATVAGKVTVPAATFSQDETTGIWTTVPGVTILTVTGNL